MRKGPGSAYDKWNISVVIYVSKLYKGSVIMHLHCCVAYLEMSMHLLTLLKSVHITREIQKRRVDLNALQPQNKSG
jgi:hypothetical protein